MAKPKHFPRVFQTLSICLHLLATFCFNCSLRPHSNSLACKIPWTEAPGGLQSMGSLRVGHDWATSLFTVMHWRRKWWPTPVFLPGESQGRGNLVGAVSGVTQSQTQLKWLSSGSSSSLRQVLPANSKDGHQQFSVSIPQLRNLCTRTLLPLVIPTEIPRLTSICLICINSLPWPSDYNLLARSESFLPISGA